MKQKLSIKRILIDLISIQPQIKEYFKDNIKYKKVVDFICAKDYFNDDDLPYPTLKEVEVGTGLSSQKVRKLLNEMYKDLFDYEIGHVFSFPSIEIYVNAEYLKNWASFRCDNLQYIPREGETVKFSFLKAKINIEYFYVYKVEHTFHSNKQVVDIWLKGGSYNSYWSFRLDKALATGEIGFGEVHRLHDFEIEERLGIRH
ncbi:hypothetical protein GCM10009430_27740 [Aquimarina litoralis]|uniref:Uncharacterized protein n=1 Tax=Aquimarina litoralis TaxID=584605 RepID=A0ABP3U3U3_9FLAO